MIWWSIYFDVGVVIDEFYGVFEVLEIIMEVFY